MPPKKCECPLADDVEDLKMEVFGDHSRNKPGLSPMIHGDGNGNPGIVRKMDAMNLKLAIIIGGLVLLLSAWATDFATRNLRMPFQPPSNNMSQSITTDATDGPTSPWYTSDEVAAIDRITPRTVRERAARGEYGEAASKDPSGQWRFDRAVIDTRAKVREGTQTSADAREGARGGSADQ